MSLFTRTPAIMGNNQEGSKRVEALLSELRSDLTDRKLSSQKQQTLLEQLKVLGRDPNNSTAIFAKDGISVLSHYAFDVQELGVAREASRCLANAMLLKEGPRQIVVDLGYVDKAVERLENDDRDDEFLLSRIIFLLTYTKSVDWTKLVQEQSLATSICRNIAGHAQRIKNPSTRQAHPMDEMALAESQKLLFNITANNIELVPEFNSCVPDLFTILTNTKLPSLPLQPPISTTINALMNLDIDSTSASSNTNTDRLITILDSSLRTYAESDLEQTALPLVTLLRKYHTAASPEAQASLKSSLLPTDASRDKPLGKDDSLPSRLLRLSLPAIRNNLSALLFELSGSDPAIFIHNVGYGNAAGFLASNGIDVSPELMQAAGAAAAAPTDGAEDVNPITGQRRAAERVVDEGPEMTEDEKMREAERLYVLFERLRATGVVNVQNPVHQARDEGRFEELDDD